jgi:predicted DsbA family dithiol-disulfide isomerase
MSEVDAKIGKEAFELEKKLYTLRKQALDNILESELLSREAQRRSQSLEQLLNAVASKTAPPDAAAVDREFSQNRDSLTYLADAVARYRILLELEANQRTDTLRQFADGLRRSLNVQVLLQEPHREVHLAHTDCHLGNEKGAVQLVEFLDYDCPFCKQLEPALAALLKSSQSSSSGDQLGIVIKQLPLPIHRTSRRAALAATCAAKQNKFAQFHDKLLMSEDHGDAAMLQLAKDSGLDAAELSKCMTSDEANRQVEADLADAAALGLDGTPSLILDGVKLEYSDVDDLKRQISAILASHGKSGASEVPGGEQ